MRLSPLKAIQQFCSKCSGGKAEIKRCGGEKCLNGGCDSDRVCWFFMFRLGNGRPSVRMIRQMCLYCQGEQRDFVSGCIDLTCSLHPFRMGTNPSRTKAPQKSEDNSNSPRKQQVRGGFEAQNPRSTARVKESIPARSVTRKKPASTCRKSTTPFEERRLHQASCSVARESRSMSLRT